MTGPSAAQPPAPSYDEVDEGAALPVHEVRLTRADLVRYAGASGDFNPIHWSERVATSVGLPGVIVHGMLTMAHGARAVTAWTDDPGALVEYSVRFTRPVVVPDDDDGAVLRIEGVVAKKLEDRCVRVELTATSGGTKVLGQARAVVRLP